MLYVFIKRDIFRLNINSQVTIWVIEFDRLVEILGSIGTISTMVTDGSLSLKYIKVSPHHCVLYDAQSMSHTFDMLHLRGSIRRPPIDQSV